MNPPMIFPDDSPRARTTDPLTSHEAADVSASSVALSHRVVEKILEDASGPLTDVQIIHRAIWEHGYRLSESRIRTARKELQTQGRVVDAGVTRVEGHRARMHLWKLSAA